MKNPKTSLLSLILGAMAVGFMPSAHAVLMLSISDGTNTVSLSDNGAGDGSGINGQIVYSGILGSTNIVTSVAYSKPLYGSASEPTIHLDGSLFSPNASTVTFMLTDTNFTATGAHTTSSVSSNATGASGASYATYYDAGNNPFATTTMLSSFNFNSPGSYAGTSGAGISVAGPYSLTLVGTIYNNTGVSSFNYDVKVPEPGTMALLGIGMMGVGFAAYRRKVRA